MFSRYGRRVATSDKTTWLLGVCLILSGLSSQLGRAGPASSQIDSLKRQVAKEIIQTPASVSLKTIFNYQEALDVECAKYNEQNLRQLSHLVKFSDDNEQFRLPNFVLVKVPAICLFILSQQQPPEDNIESSQASASSHQLLLASSGDATTPSSKRDLVNWIYNVDNIKRLDGGTNKTKRQTENFDNGLISDYLLDPSVPTNKIDEEEDVELAKFHRDVGKIMENDAFHEAIDENRQNIASHLSPVVLIPGLLGSRLQAKTDKTTRVNIFCSKQSDWQDLWLSIRQLLPIAVDCWLDNARLEYDPSSGFSRSPVGIVSRVPDFGNLESVSHLDLRQPTLSNYFKPLIDRYLQLGYTANRNLLAAPYDFRLAPQELESSYFVELKQLIEMARTSSGSDRKVTLVCHSMGCTHALVFLRKQSATWRQSHIRKLIALSSPWGGAIKALKALVVGDSLDLPLVSEPKMRKLARTFPSMAYLLPQAEIFSQSNKFRADSSLGGPVLVQTPLRSYRVSEMDQLLRDLNLTLQLDWFKHTTALIKPLEPLHDLNIDCIYSSNTPTPETLVFRNHSDFPNGDYELVKGAGDGTVNLASLLVCDQWARMLPNKVKSKEITSSNHVGVIGAKDTLAHITDDVFMS